MKSLGRYSVKVIVVPTKFFEYTSIAYRCDIYLGRYLVGEQVATSKNSAVRLAVHEVRRRRHDGALPLFFDTPVQCEADGSLEVVS